ncbi:hypothetical protein, partial [Aquitalea magnusonii]|uniref:hypothetical protein n=1 Tax=Aquitalea magnusonii TaxID=332411 RepID=UPI000A86D9CF
PWRQLFAANLDIMVRTLLLTVSFALMTRSGAQLGTLTLAANQLLLQAFMAPWRQLFAANLDIMVRTLLLTVSFALMTRSGAQ